MPHVGTGPMSDSSFPFLAHRSAWVWFSLRISILNVERQFICPIYMFYSNDAVQPQWSSDSVWRPTAEWVPVRSTPLPLGLQRLLRQRRFDQQPQVDPNNISIEPSEYRVIQSGLSLYWIKRWSEAISGQILTRWKSTTLGSWEQWIELNTPLNIFQNYGIWQLEGLSLDEGNSVLKMYKNYQWCRMRNVISVTSIKVKYK